MSIPQPIPTSRRYTIFVTFPAFNTVEEIDVDAASPTQAKDLAQIELDRDYEPGGVITRVVERFGWYI